MSISSIIIINLYARACSNTHQILRNICIFKSHLMPFAPLYQWIKNIPKSPPYSDELFGLRTILFSNYGSYVVRFTKKRKQIADEPKSFSTKIKILVIPESVIAVVHAAGHTLSQYTCILDSYDYYFLCQRST